ncbi:MAG: sodium:proton antiporter NhaD [Chlamydiota bacterium]|jgi:NhaD family Na+/H+ antiporter
MTFFHYLIISVFSLGYLAIILEHNIKINKTAAALLMSVAVWALIFIGFSSPEIISLEKLNEYVGDVSQIIFFLLGAMTLVEVIDSHKGFKIITDLIRTRSKKKMLWLIGFIAFFLSALLDNLTTTIVMISLLRKLIDDPKERMLIGSMVVIAANAGGAWTPIGDVTTTMLWINGQVTTVNVIKSLFIPSFFSLIVSLFLLSFRLKGSFHIKNYNLSEKEEPGAKLVFCVGVGALVFVPIFKALTGLPPFMGMLIGLGVLWLVTDIYHHKYENRHHLRVPHVLTKIDTSGVLFFLGILLSIHALEAVGILKQLAMYLSDHLQNIPLIASAIGVISAIVDNVPLVAACMGMYDLQSYPTDSPIWMMIAYAAGTGGSILIIGSAAGVALMGMEKISFMWYLKRISLTALSGYLAGMALYLLLQVL